MRNTDRPRYSNTLWDMMFSLLYQLCYYSEVQIACIIWSLEMNQCYYRAICYYMECYYIEVCLYPSMLFKCYTKRSRHKAYFNNF